MTAAIRMRSIWKNIEERKDTFLHISAEMIANILQRFRTTAPFENATVAAKSASAWIYSKTTVLLRDTFPVRNTKYLSKARVRIVILCSKHPAVMQERLGTLPPRVRKTRHVQDAGEPFHPPNLSNNIVRR